MGTAIRTSAKAVAVFLAGLLSLACGLLALASSDLFLTGVALLMVLALALAVLSWKESGLRGATLAGLGMTLSAGGFALVFLRLSAT
jgi:hypothetical protein